MEEVVNETKPFLPDRVSTPYPEQVEMKTMLNEQSGLPDTSYDEPPLLGDFFSAEGKQKKVDYSTDFIKRRFPKVDLKKLDPIGISKKGTKTEVVSFGLKGGETPIFKRDGSGFLKAFTDKFKKYLGPSAEKLKAEENETIKEQQQRLEEAEKQKREAETIAAEREKELLEMENLEQQTERVQARIDAIHEELGSNLESEIELKRVEQLKKNHQAEYEKKKKEVAALENKPKTIKRPKKRFQEKEQSSTKW